MYLITSSMSLMSLAFEDLQILSPEHGRLSEPPGQGTVQPMSQIRCGEEWKKWGPYVGTQESEDGPRLSSLSKKQRREVKQKSCKNT